ncbi:hypothetical protein FN846DRAFT_918868 [Sphaerosporella brunnea]|uniref:Uncharacterized protein n=1 Tax=Sphaerosporella brunnea TaxID=1250544 RepID=A0A5J5EXW7_9PEZI|nr:hypothetical protein FN846DRAFT_918868 [Sphaerosporella brunnea]
MAAGKWFGSRNVFLTYGVTLGVLFVLVLTFAVAKLWLRKRREALITAQLLAKAAEEEEALVQQGITRVERVEGEADLFGIRALERGFTGGVPQARPSTDTLGRRTTPSPLPEDGMYMSMQRIPYGRDPSNPLFSRETSPISLNEQISSASGSTERATSPSSLPPPRHLFPASSASRTTLLQAATLVPTRPPPGTQLNLPQYTGEEQHLRVPVIPNSGFVSGYKLRKMARNHTVAFQAQPPPPESQANIQNLDLRESNAALQESGNENMVPHSEQTMVSPSPPPGNTYVRPYSWGLGSENTQRRPYSWQTESLNPQEEVLTVIDPLARNAEENISDLSQPAPVHVPEPGTIRIVIRSPEDPGSSSASTSSYSCSIDSEDGDIGVTGARLGPAAYTSLIRGSSLSLGEFYDSYYSENGTPRIYPDTSDDEEVKTDTTHKPEPYTQGHKRNWSRMPSRLS